MRRYDYLLVTNDRYEFPIHIAKSLVELAKISGYAYEAVKKSYERDTALDGVLRLGL